MKQYDIVLNILHKRGSVTQKQVLRHGIMRLGGIIYKLRKNHEIMTVMKTARTKHGVSNYAKYVWIA